MAIHNPPQFINGYLQEKIATFGLGATPMYPSMPTDFSIASGFTMSQLVGDDPAARYTFNGNAAIYDRMFKMRRKPFPHIKSEQVLYYFYAVESTAVTNLIEITQRIQDLLDGEDESAQDINAWSAAKQASATPLLDANGDPLLKPFFHSIKVFQLEETRDIIDFGTARTFAGNKIIIDYDWHKTA